MILIILTIIFGVLSIVLLLGKGSFLIAGYNTASAAQKQQYDEKKLCRTMGIGMGLIALGLLAAIINSDIGTYVMLITMIIGILFIVIGTNFCYTKEYLEAHQNEKKSWFRNKTIWSTAITLIIVLGVSAIMLVGNINIKYHDRYMTIGASLSKTTEVYYGDITKLEYLKDLDLGTRKFGIGNVVMGAGSFKNDKFGSYTLYSYNQCKEYIVMYTELGTVVVNDKTPDETQKLYQKIKNYVK